MQNVFYPKVFKLQDESRYFVFVQAFKVSHISYISNVTQHKIIKIVVDYQMGIFFILSTTLVR